MSKMIGLKLGLWGIVLSLGIGINTVAQARPLNCRANESTFVTTETKSYWVNICGGDLPGYYVAMNKQDQTLNIRLPLTDWDRQGNYFEAVNGDYTYILAKTPKGMFLTVSKGTKELLREVVLVPW